MKKKPGINREIVLMLIVVIISVSFIFLVFSYYGRIMKNADAASEELNPVYQYQYEMIVDSRNQTFWKDVYDIVNIGLHFILKNVRPYAASCSEA